MTDEQWIIFDTNAVNMLNPDGITADIIRKLKGSGHHRVAVPWMVLEELSAHKAKHYPAQYQAAVKALEKLDAAVPWAVQSSLEPLDLERLLDHWRDAYGKIFEVIETSGDVARKALAREAMALPPAKRADDHSEGARDVAIWFSVLEFLRTNPQARVCLVTNNHTDFGDGTSYPYPMNEDVRGLEDRLSRLKGFTEVVSTFTTPVAGDDAVVAARALLESPPVRSRVAQSAEELLSAPLGFTGLSSAGNTARWSSWILPPKAELLDLTDVTGHEIEGDIWYTAKAQWLLFGVAAPGEPDSLIDNVSAVWETRLLFSTRGEAQPPTILNSAEPSVPDLTDERCAAAVQKFKTDLTEASKRPMPEKTVAASGLDVVGSGAGITTPYTSFSPTARLSAQFADLGLTKNVTAQFANLSLGRSVMEQYAAMGLGRSAMEQYAAMGLSRSAMEQYAAMGLSRSAMEQAAAMGLSRSAMEQAAALGLSLPMGIAAQYAAMGLGRSAMEQAAANLLGSEAGAGTAEEGGQDPEQVQGSAADG
ncbi:PIN domain-containing protein [Kitasatospora phosalacinea]|uniref:PIN domain-containing protein n=1 Tax=Kitasatospora phosalacinea TaxID=2065 RepID=UPI00131AC04E|nr:PIN domain-containing protein [Kitasatospora phosalacinea]